MSKLIKLYSKYEQFFVYQLHLNKAIKKNLYFITQSGFYVY